MGFVDKKLSEITPYKITLETMMRLLDQLLNLLKSLVLKCLLSLIKTAKS